MAENLPGIIDLVSARPTLASFFLFCGILAASRAAIVRLWFEKCAAPLGVFLCGSLAAYFLALTIRYAAMPFLIDHIEASVVSLSLLAADGQPVYTALDSPQRISLLYGPVVYLAFAPFAAMFPDPILGGKIAALLFMLASIATFIVCVRHDLRLTQIMLIVGGGLLLYLVFGRGKLAMMIRGDAVLLLAISIGCASLWIKQRNVAAIVLALALALAANCKLHAPLYVLPLVPVFWQQLGLGRMAGAGLVAIAFLALPFLVFDAFSVGHYFAWLAQATKHRFILGDYFSNASYAVFVLVPLMLISFHQERAGARPVVFFLAFLGIAGIAVITAKEGSNIGQFLPFVPVVMHIVALHLSHRPALPAAPRQETRSADSLRAAALVAWIVVGAVTVFEQQRPVVRFLAGDSGLAARDDLRDILARYDNYSLVMGYTSAQFGTEYVYRYSFFSPLLVKKSKEHFLDPAAMMDMEAARITIPDATFSRIEEEYYDLFVLPKNGRPFSLRSWYTPRRPIFGTVFPKLFQQHYRVIDTTDYFSIWAASRLQPDLGNRSAEP